MIKQKLGAIKLSPIKEKGKFVFLNNELRVNGKLNKGDQIKLFVGQYAAQGTDFKILDPEQNEALIVVRKKPFVIKPEQNYSSVSAFYQFAEETYLNQFYFGEQDQNK